ncbi:MAG: pilin [Proteobacteria bacterium]|nr:pilin [Pseudomonadota bacterium]
MKLIQKGLTRIEWLIIVAVLGILAAAVYPVYKTYTVRPRFSEVVETMAPYKAAIENCAKNGSCVEGGALARLGVGKLGVPPSISTTYLARVSVSPNGVITAVASNAGGLSGETFVLTPSLSKTMVITWAVGGTCKTRATGAIC